MIGATIKRIRKLKELGLNELARKSNISGSYLSNIEKGIKNNPSIEALQKIAEALNVPVDEFFKSERLGEDPISKGAKTASTLDIIPEEFADPEEARSYISKHKIFSSDGFNANKLSDYEILEFGNALLEQMKMVSYKYKK